MAKVTGYNSLCMAPWLKLYPTGPSGEQLQKVAEIASMLVFYSLLLLKRSVLRVLACVCTYVYRCMSVFVYLSVCIYACFCGHLRKFVCICLCVCVCVVCVLHAHTCACPCIEVGILVQTSLHYGFVGCLPLSCPAISPIQIYCPKNDTPLCVPS